MTQFITKKIDKILSSAFDKIFSDDKYLDDDGFIDRFDYVIRSKVIRFFDDLFLGHDWGKWSKPNERCFITVADKSSRECKRCYKSEERKWTPKELKIIVKNKKDIKEALLNSNGKIGELYGVRFLERREVN